ncbi:PREDICTED: adrenocortical dysplasia protein homolog [Cyprinodon variegatus]|uniref:adrenocortical dysplasia protein homolog n=1 Tax=Cyprinodon variegatus TaxID=28743 RepID=UPI0007428369|nr:PREDICTED: adrenocortical dysplasia protein homolog [Cyprinodon variegatus]
MRPRSKLTPWIENLIMSYGSREDPPSGHLKAHVIGVGQMSESQAPATDGPTGLLFLSDGSLQMPAVLTASAWETLQEQEDRESFSSLPNSTVILKNFMLQFHMDPEQTRCWFFLSVGEMATFAAGPVKDSPPCCTSLASVRMKICRTWRSLLGQEDSQSSQGGMDLSELLGAWQHDCLQTLLEDVRKKLLALRSPQPSTSAPSLSLSCSTRWDLDRVRYRGQPSFSIPERFLLIPEGDAGATRQVEAECRKPEPAGGGMGSRPDGGTRTGPARGTGSSSAGEMGSGPAGEMGSSRAGETGSGPAGETGSIPDGPAGEMGSSPAGEMGSSPAGETGSAPVEETGSAPGEETGSAPGEHSPSLMEDDPPLPDLAAMLPSNPWDIYPPPDVSFCSSNSSPDSTPTPPRATPDCVARATSTQPPIHSFLPPYQNQPLISLPASSSSTSPAEPQASDGANAQNGQEDDTQASYRKPKRKRCEEAAVEEEEELSGGPPSWLFDSQIGASRSRDEDCPTLTDAGAALRTPPSVHSDGRPFTYSYTVTGQNLQDFSRFRVAASLLHWAMRYLLSPKPPSEKPHSAV